MPELWNKLPKAVSRYACHRTPYSFARYGVCRKKPRSGEMFIARDRFLYRLSYELSKMRRILLNS